MNYVKRLWLRHKLDRLLTKIREARYQDMAEHEVLQLQYKAYAIANYLAALRMRSRV